MTARLYDALVNLAAHPVAWPLARAARRYSRNGVLRVPGVGVLVSDAAVAHEILVRSHHFTKNGPGSISATMTEMIGPSALANMDGEPHRLLRSKLSDLFAPPNARTLLQAADTPLARLRADLRDGRVVDLVRWMRVLSGRITLDMLGITLPAGEEEAAALSLVALGERIVAGFDLRQPSERQRRRMRADCDRLAEYIRVGYDSADAPSTSLIRRLRELGLSFDEARGVLSLIFLAGTLSTAVSLPRIVALLVDSGQLAALRGCPEAISRALAEGLRYVAPVPATVRIAARDTSVLGHHVAAGSRLVILTCNLARDRALFPDPDHFDASRVHDPRARNLWYGAGPHFCLGFAVAQREMFLALEALVAEPGELRIVHRRVGMHRLLAGYSVLEIQLDGGRGR
jgi:cytochrome P450